MSIHRRIITDGMNVGDNATTREWVSSDDEVVAFARDMVAADFINTAAGLLEYFEKPWGWEREHAWWVANGRPDTWEMWDKGVDEDWEVAA